MNSSGIFTYIQHLFLTGTSVARPPLQSKGRDWGSVIKLTRKDTTNK